MAIRRPFTSPASSSGPPFVVISGSAQGVFVIVSNWRTFTPPNFRKRVRASSGWADSVLASVLIAPTVNNPVAASGGGLMINRLASGNVGGNQPSKTYRSNDSFGKTGFGDR